MQKYYESCLADRQSERGNISLILDTLEELGGFPMLNASWEPRNISWHEQARILGQRGLPFEFFFGIEVNDPEDKVEFELTEPLLGIYANDLQEGLKNNDTRDYLKRTTEAVKSFFPALKLNETLKDLEDIIGMEISLAQLLYNGSVYLRPEQTTFKDINAASDWGFQWEEMISEVLASDVPFPEDWRFTSHLAGKGKPLFDLLGKTPRRTLANYIGWSLIRQSLPNLGNLGRTTAKSLKGKSAIIVGGFDEEKVDDNEACIKLVRGKSTWAVDAGFDNFEVLSAHILAKNYLPESSRQVLEEMIVDLKHSMRKLIEKSEWMDFDIRFLALDKLDALALILGYPEDILSVPFITSLYHNINLTVNQY